MKPNISVLMGSERQRARVALDQRKAQEAADNEKRDVGVFLRLSQEAVDNERRGKALLEQLQRCSELKVLIHDVDIMRLPSGLRAAVVAELDRLDFEVLDTTEVIL